MDKYLKKVGGFLESYVQFLVLGLAGLLLLWTLWTYVLDPGVASAPFGTNDTVGPGEVDQRVYDTEGKALERTTASEAGIMTEVRPRDVEILVGRTRQIGEPIAADELALVGPRSPVPDYTRPEEDGGAGTLDSLPELPPATITFANSGKAMVDVPEVGEEDVVFVAVRWSLPMNEIRDRFASVALPSRVSQTSLLDVKLIRERQLSSGEFGETTDIADLRNVTWPKMPDESATREDKQIYLEFARGEPMLIAQPPFYPVLAGDRPEEVAAEPLPEEEAEEGEEAAPPERPRRPNPNDGRRPPYGPNSGGRPPVDPYGGGGFDPYGGNDPFGGGGEFGGGGTEFGGDPYGGDYSQPQTQERDRQIPVYIGGEVPGEFNPATGGVDIEGVIYDETAEPGETYRYNIVYSLRNPLFDTVKVADNPELESQLALTAARDELWRDGWSEPTTVAPIRRWFMKSVGTPQSDGRVRDARFSVFRWQKGSWNEETFKVEAGDPVGGVVDGIDYFTGRFLVDMRDDLADDKGRDMIAVLTGTDGVFTSHRPDEDESDEYDEFLELATENDEVADGR